MLIWVSLLAALLLASVHIFSAKLRVLKGVPRSRLLSVVGGMAVAFVVLRLLPAIAEHQRALEEEARGGPFAFLNRHVYIALLASIVIYYGLERLAKESRKEKKEKGETDRATHSVFWLHTATFALMNLLIGYLLVYHAEEQKGVQFLALFTLAMLFKFIVNDHGLHRDHKELYDRKGRWLLVGAVLLGWTVNYITDLPRSGPALLQAFIAGGILLNVLKEELPPERRSRYWAFALGAGAYSVLLLSF